MLRRISRSAYELASYNQSMQNIDNQTFNQILNQIRQIFFDSFSMKIRVSDRF